MLFMTLGPSGCLTRSMDLCAASLSLAIDAQRFSRVRCHEFWPPREAPKWNALQSNEEQAFLLMGENSNASWCCDYGLG